MNCQLKAKAEKRAVIANSFLTANWFRNCAIARALKDLLNIIIIITHINEKEIPGVLLIFTVKARSLNPKLQQIAHF